MRRRSKKPSFASPKNGKSQSVSRTTGLPEAYETRVGERGVALSGGQRQRLSIARGVVPGPGVMIFDDSTAAIDAVSDRTSPSGGSIGGGQYPSPGSGLRRSGLGIAPRAPVRVRHDSRDTARRTGVCDVHHAE